MSKVYLYLKEKISIASYGVDNPDGSVYSEKVTIPYTSPVFKIPE